MFTYFVTAVRTVRRVYIYKALVDGLSAYTTKKIDSCDSLTFSDTRSITTVCVCARARARVCKRDTQRECVCERECVCVRERVCVCVRERECVCVCHTMHRPAASRAASVKDGSHHLLMSVCSSQLVQLCQ